MALRATMFVAAPPHGLCPSAAAVLTGNLHGFRRPDKTLLPGTLVRAWAVRATALYEAPIVHRRAKQSHIFTGGKAASRVKYFAFCSNGHNLHSAESIGSILT